MNLFRINKQTKENTNQPTCNFEITDILGITSNYSKDKMPRQQKIINLNDDDACGEGHTNAERLKGSVGT